METRQIHVRDLSTVTGIQQFEHEVQSIYFLGLEDFVGTIYLSIESEEYSNEAIPLTSNTFIIGQPMTKFNTTFTCQIYGVLNDGEKIQLSKRFRLIVDKSNTIQGESSEYPIDPNFENSIIEFVTEQKSELNTYTDAQKSEIEATGEAVIATIPSDYSTLTNEVSDLKSAITQLNDVVQPLTIEATEALAYYPFAPENGDTVVIKSKNDTEYAGTWSALFYTSDKSTLLQQANVTTSQTTKEINITASGIAYFRPNINFSGDVFVSALTGNSLLEQVEKNANDIATNSTAIAENAKDIADIKEGNNNLYDGITLISGRVYAGIYSDAITTFHCTDYLPVIPGNTYAIYGGYIDSNYSNYYDKNKVYKGSLPLENLVNTSPYTQSNNCLIFTAPSDAYYVRLNYLNSDLIDGDTLRPEWYFRDITGKKLANKRVLVIGDSISTDVYGNYKKWVTNLLDNGVLSTGFTKNNSKHATGYVATYASQANTTFIERLTALGDLSGYDLIITFGGINDWIQSIDFDAFKTAVDTYYSYLIENATQARIAVLTPLHTSLYGTNNSAGKAQKDYDDYIKSVANDYAFPCLNLTDESGFCPDKSTSFRDMWTLLPSGASAHDGVHPNADWEKKYLSPQIEQFLMGLVS